MKALQASAKYTPRQFNTWCPKAIALIGELPSAPASRSIIIQLRRAKPSAPPARLNDQKRREIHDICQQLNTWVAPLQKDIELISPIIPDGLNGRPADNWRPLLAISEAAGDDWPARAADAAKKLSTDQQQDDPSLRVLKALRQFFDEQNADKVMSSHFAEYLLSLDEPAFLEFRNGRPISLHNIASSLRKFDIRTKTIRVGPDTKKGIARDTCQDAFERYLSTESSPQHRHNKAPAWMLTTLAKDVTSSHYASVTKSLASMRDVTL